MTLPQISTVTAPERADDFLDKNLVIVSATEEVTYEKNGTKKTYFGITFHLEDETEEHYLNISGAYAVNTLKRLKTFPVGARFLRDDSKRPGPNGVFPLVIVDWK